jgi:hypothetical protein
MLTTAALLEVVARSPGNVGPDERRRWLDAELAALGADADEVVSALASLESDDRNVRVKVLRLLALFPDARATESVLRGLRDPSRRVREVAMKSAHPHHVASPEVVSRLRAIAEDEGETGRLRRHAFFVLSSSATRTAVPDIARDSLLGLMDSARFRLPILVRLCKTATHTPESRAILHEFVRTGTKDEAIMATRALAGQVLVGTLLLSPEQRQQLQDTCDPGPRIRGTTFGENVGHSWWVPREDALELARAVGSTSRP